MATADEDNSPIQAHRPTSWLLQLPEAALAAVLQNLDSRSLASTALACTALSYAVPCSISTVSVCCKSQAMLGNLILWFNRHSAKLNHVIQCSVQSDIHHAWWQADFPKEQAVLQQLPCPSCSSCGCTGRSCSCSLRLVVQVCWGSAQPLQR